MKKLLFISLFFVSSSSVFSQGWIWNDEIQSKYEELEVLSTDTRAILPSSSSLENFAPKLPDGQDFYWSQDGTGKCVAYALAYARTLIYNRNKRTNDLKNTFSPGFIYWTAKAEGADCFDGLDPVISCNVLLNYGAAKLIDVEYPNYYPFEDKRICYSYPPNWRDDFEKAGKYKLETVKQLRNVREIKNAVSQGIPCLYGIYTVNSFDNVYGKNLWQPNTGESPRDSEAIHALVVIAYDDSKYGGSFLIQNSWGKEWGNHGRIWIKYDDFMEYNVAVFGLQKRYERWNSPRLTEDDLIDVDLPDFSKKEYVDEFKVYDKIDKKLFESEE